MLYFCERRVRKSNKNKGRFCISCFLVRRREETYKLQYAEECLAGTDDVWKAESVKQVVLKGILRSKRLPGKQKA